jgi:fluoride exporter
MLKLIAVFVGGGVGSVLRYGLSVWIPRAAGSFPWATLMTNVMATLLLAFLVGRIGKGLSAPDQMWYLLLGMGLCGGFSTFSTFSMETFDLWRTGQMAGALIYATASMLACVGGIALLLRILDV